MTALMRQRFESPRRSTRVGLVRALLDVPYGRARGSRHRLDLYLPAGTRFPVVVFVHGGSWCSGDKSLYGHVGAFLAGHGVGAVLVNYRLSPQDRHPAHVEDVARAFHWAWGHAGGYGGDRDRLYLLGHSAGGHLASLLAADGRHLGRWGLGPAAVRGVVSLSGVYRIHYNVDLHGVGFVFPRGERAAASPLLHVGPGCPRFLLLYAEKEMWTLAGQARRFHRHLLANGVASRLVRVAGESHDSIVHSLVVPGSRPGEEVLRFLREA